MGFESGRLGNLRWINIDSHVKRHIDPWNDARDLVKVHGAARPQPVDNLLHPRCSAFWRCDNEDISGIRLIVQTTLPALRSCKIFEAFMHFLNGCWAFEVFFVKHFLLPPNY